jgi:hypothetical protein
MIGMNRFIRLLVGAMLSGLSGLPTAFAQDECSEISTSQQVDRCSEIAKKAADLQLNVSGSAVGGGSNVSCPSEDFAQFLPAFSANAESQKRLTALAVKSLVLKPTADLGQFVPLTSGMKGSNLAFPLMAPLATGKTDGVEIEVVDDSNINVVDKRAGNSNIKLFKFSRQACWVLVGVEDWSIREKDFSASSETGRTSAENFCFQRAQVFLRLGGLKQYPLTKELYEAALENYLCAAKSGDPEASLAAASLSLSGMAPQLETSKVEALYKAAATTLAQGATGLSTFYCYGNGIAEKGPCQHPAQAERELIRAISMGSTGAIISLGFSFETGELGTRDLPRALACYQLAADQGNEMGVYHLKQLRSQDAESIKASHCF